MNDEYRFQDKIPKINPEIVRNLTKLKPLRSVLALFIDWALIILSVLICEIYSYWFYPIALVIVGSRFHAIEALMHEATHYRFHPNRELNDFFGELMTWPLGYSAFVYRKFRHFTHHRHIGSKADSHLGQIYYRHPERFEYPAPVTTVIKNIIVVGVLAPYEVWLSDLWTTTKIWWKYSKTIFGAWVLFQLSIYVGLLLLTYIFGSKVLLIFCLFFVLPFIWMSIFSRYLRLVWEHFAIPQKTENEKSVAGGFTRTVLMAWPCRVIFWPHSLNYHLEHHWFPSVPYYNLRQLHSLLVQEPGRMHITRGVRALVSEIIAKN